MSHWPTSWRKVFILGQSFAPQILCQTTTFGRNLWPSLRLYASQTLKVPLMEWTRRRIFEPLPNMNFPFLDLLELGMNVHMWGYVEVILRGFPSIPCSSLFIKFPVIIHWSEATLSHRALVVSYARIPRQDRHLLPWVMLEGGSVSISNFPEGIVSYKEIILLCSIPNERPRSLLVPSDESFL